MEGIICIGTVILGTVSAGFFLIRHLDRTVDKSIWSFKQWQRGLLFSAAFLNTLWIERLAGIDRLQKLFAGILAGCLLFACVTDIKIREVYRFTWWAAGVAVSALLFCRSLSVNFDTDKALSSVFFLFAYIVMQEFLFCRVYGRADCHAFVVCAAAQTVFGRDMEWYFLHMTLSFGMLIAVELIRGNINTQGRLKAPAAFLPYITFSFWIVMSLRTSVFVR